MNSTPRLPLVRSLQHAQIAPNTVRLAQFGGTLPATRVFSGFARNSIRDAVSAVDDPDSALSAWLDHEEKLFRRFEHFAIAMRLDEGFVKNGQTDVEGFVLFSLRVQNARKSRMGLSLEHHLEEVFIQDRLRFERGRITEHKNKPDFLFPGAKEYHDSSFPPDLLTMLASKSTCRDRWRQVLSEAQKIPLKHLVTIEPGISRSQTDEMEAKGLQLILPKRLHSSFDDHQRSWLYTIKDFVKLVRDRQIN